MSTLQETPKKDIEYLWVRDYISNLALKDLGVSPEEMGKGWYESTTEIADFRNLEQEESRLQQGFTSKL